MAESDASAIFLEHYRRLGNVENAVAQLATRYARHIAEAVACESGHVPARYRRNLGTFGQMGQARLLRSSVMVVGLGGLGGYVAEQLARCGVGKIAGVDPDRFDATNLNRQLLATADNLGRYKADVAKERISGVNEAVEFTACACRIEDLDPNAYATCNLLFDCLDSIPTRLFLEETIFDIPIVHGAIGGWYGQVALIEPGSRLLARIYGSHRQGIERELGNPPFTPAFIASWMVSEGVKVLLGQKKPDNVLLYFDLLQNYCQHLQF